MTTTLDNPIRTYACEALRRYWSGHAAAIEGLAMRRADGDGGRDLPPRVEMVRLPDWETGDPRLYLGTTGGDFKMRSLVLIPLVGQ